MLAIRIILDAPKLLAEEVLVGDNALGVPVYSPGFEHPDARQIAKERLEFTLERVRQGLAKDIREGRISVEVGGLKDPEPPRAELRAAPE